MDTQQNVSSVTEETTTVTTANDPLNTEEKAAPEKKFADLGNKLGHEALDGFKKLNSSSQFAFIGVVLGLISTVLPWWSRTTKTGPSPMTEGINIFQWPLYLGGFLMFLVLLFLAAAIAFEYLGKPLPKISLSQSQLYLLGGAFIGIQSIIAFTAYSHSFFSITTTQMQSGIGYGAYVWILASLIIITASFAQKKIPTLIK